jgi:hypothetical protein
VHLCRVGLSLRLLSRYRVCHILSVQSDSRTLVISNRRSHLRTRASWNLRGASVLIRNPSGKTFTGNALTFERVLEFRAALGSAAASGEDWYREGPNFLGQAGRPLARSPMWTVKFGCAFAWGAWCRSTPKIGVAVVMMLRGVMLRTSTAGIVRGLGSSLGSRRSSQGRSTPDFGDPATILFNFLFYLVGKQRQRSLSVSALLKA